MTDKPESRKKKSATTETPIHTIRAGAVAASIWRRQSPAGYVYFDFSLTRSWKSLSSGSTGYSRNFFARNHAELAEVIDKASRWIADHGQATFDDPHGTANSRQG
jgi:hypothetical protein